MLDVRADSSTSIQENTIKVPNNETDEQMKILSFLLKSADSQVLFFLRPRGRYEAMTRKIARIANPALHSSLILSIIALN